jgi:undecaprenyl-diphosphatase
MSAWARLVGRVDSVIDAAAAWDVRAMRAVSDSAALQKLSRVFVTASYLGDGYLWGSLGLGLILFGRSVDRIYVLIGLGVSIVNIAVFRFLKVMVGRKRPDGFVGSLRFRPIDSFAFPSGHATTSFGLAWLVSVTYPHPLVIAAVYLVASIIAFSRVYMREHYPLDVLFGACLGTVTTALLLPFFRWLFF